MTKQIGPTFGAELYAAGCNDEVTFRIGGNDSDIRIYAPISTAASLASSVQSVVDAHDPTKR